MMLNLSLSLPLSLSLSHTHTHTYTHTHTRKHSDTHKHTRSFTPDYIPTLLSIIACSRRHSISHTHFHTQYFCTLSSHSPYWFTNCIYSGLDLFFQSWCLFWIKQHFWTFLSHFNTYPIDHWKLWKDQSLTIICQYQSLWSGKHTYLADLSFEKLLVGSCFAGL